MWSTTVSTSQHDRGLGFGFFQRRDVEIQRRDVEIQRRDVTERVKLKNFTKLSKFEIQRLNGIYGTLLFSELFSELCDMSNQIAENLVICASHSLYRCNPILRPLIVVSSSIL